MATTEILPETCRENGQDTIVTTRQAPSLKMTHFCELKKKICLTGCEFCKKSSCQCVSHRHLRTRVLRL
ncbi:hypothetical protein J2741_001667 [Methanolinea mesophila]|uniref:hypothetical protein n=1 Tax=Methanolinea mesophila TaxID=547055 RepID=UPI001AE10A86|nr:hypothetical protein [Methanolinea mesophila]MBP1929120.1 hypothetical protein [Methanolinea mesophila]